MPNPIAIALVSVDGSAHRPIMARWLIQDHVQQWWGDPALNLTDFDVQPPQRHMIVSAGEIPIGYVRWQRFSGQELAAMGVHGLPDGTVIIDLFIGEAGWLGHGVGPAALVLLLKTLRADPTVPVAAVSTSVQNVRAIRAYEKAGFLRYCQHDDSESGPCWMMIVRLTPTASHTEYAC